MDRTVDPKLASNPVFLRVMQDALSIQDRFSAEPVYARTGKGFLKSAGVDNFLPHGVRQNQRTKDLS